MVHAVLRDGRCLPGARSNAHRSGSGSSFAALDQAVRPQKPPRPRGVEAKQPPASIPPFARKDPLHVSTLSLTIDAPPKHSRLTTFFRYILAIPLLIINYLYGIGAYVVAFIAWFAIVFTGRYPAGLYSFEAGYLRFSTRAMSYLMLAVDTYPPFNGDAAPAYPVHVEIPERLERYSRLKTFFRIIYIVPAYVAVIVLGLALYVVVVLSWFSILITARDPFAAYKQFALGWVLKFAALYLLVVENY
jgi:Domain of unknown function (DUF4389)